MNYLRLYKIIQLKDKAWRNKECFFDTFKIHSNNVYIFTSNLNLDVFLAKLLYNIQFISLKCYYMSISYFKCTLGNEESEMEIGT